MIREISRGVYYGSSVNPAYLCILRENPRRSIFNRVFRLARIADESRDTQREREASCIVRLKVISCLSFNFDFRLGKFSGTNVNEKLKRNVDSRISRILLSIVFILRCVKMDKIIGTKVKKKEEEDVRTFKISQNQI